MVNHYHMRQTYYKEPNISEDFISTVTLSSAIDGFFNPRSAGTQKSPRSRPAPGFKQAHTAVDSRVQSALVFMYYGPFMDDF